MNVHKCEELFAAFPFQFITNVISPKSKSASLNATSMIVAVIFRKQHHLRFYSQSFCFAGTLILPIVGNTVEHY